MSTDIAKNWPYPRLIAHRGAGKLAPENTLTALRVGHAHGYRMVEFDVKLSADNVAFLLHDATLERTTTGRGRADALPGASCRASTPAAGTRPSTPASRCPRSPRSPAGLARMAWRATSRSSPRPGASARRARRSRSMPTRFGAKPTCRRCCRRFRRRRWPPRATPYRRCRERCCWTSCRRIGRIVWRASNASRSMPTTRRSRPISSTHAHRAGYRVLTYTANDLERIEELAAWGVDGIITDAVDHIAADTLPPAPPLPA